ncbi:hypothetical protein [Wenzhouxiangella sp. EGI_FJ10305]|uniref:hypothetical protein n=1 Tax=Wenzhouxiangella sp. EGI_FJ10305 TaxID=3243768 RepID=UPI0035D84270
MQKFLVGCLIVVVVLVGAGGTAGYFFVIKPAWEFAGGVQEFVQEYAELNEQVERQDGFQPPEDGAISTDQFQRFLVAQRDMRQAMEGELKDLKQRFESMQQEIDDEERDANIGELFTAYEGLGGLLIKAKRVQVEALNRYNFSLQEYLYVRNQTYRALGQEVAVASFGDQAPQTRSHRVPDEVVEMVSSHREELMEGYAFAWFGI